MTDTIAAVATGSGLSAIGIIRLSGEGAILAADAVFREKGGLKMYAAENRKLYYGTLLGGDGAAIDHCLCTVSRGPNSYTGEDTAELHCHGSPTVLAEALHALFAAGARQALPGEFTKRAFLNGKLDLTQAEAVIDLIASETPMAAKNAAGQLGRSISRRTDAIYDKLVDIMSHFHAVVDYPDEDIDEFTLEGYVDTLEGAQGELSRLLSTFDRGRILKEGVKSVIIGRPNTGKSSLMNALLGYDRAIVTDIAGTTRDTIEEKVRLGNTLLRLTDTAGIRRTEDAVECIGVRRAEDAAAEAELIIAVFDGSEPLTSEDVRVLETVKAARRSIAVLNKSDLPQAVSVSELALFTDAVCVISAATGYGLEELEKTVERLFEENGEIPAGEILTNARQAEAVRRALEGIKSAGEGLAAGVTPDAVLTEVEAAMSALGELSGKTIREDITARIFERFCVGK